MGTYPTVQIITFTGQGNFGSSEHEHVRYTHESEFAARLLVFTKNTRLQMTPDGFDKFLKMPWAEIEAELNYMANTIPSSWEFASMTFAIRDVSRAAAQQITRTRFTPMDGDIFGSYAMQSQRVTDMREVGVHVPESVKDQHAYQDAMLSSLAGYDAAVKRGESLEDARGLLPMNAQCNLIVKYSLRQLVEMLRARDSLRVQGEYQEVARQMKALVLGVWPWSAPFFIPKDQKAIDLIEDVAKQMKEAGVSGDLVMNLAKAADLLKK